MYSGERREARKATCSIMKYVVTVTVFKRGVQPKCGVQTTKYGVQNGKMRSPTLSKYEIIKYFANKYTFKPKNVVCVLGTSFPRPPAGFVPQTSCIPGPLDHTGEFRLPNPFCGVHKSLNYIMVTVRFFRSQNGKIRVGVPGPVEDLTALHRPPS